MFLRKGFRKYGYMSNSAIYKKKKVNKYSTCKMTKDSINFTSPLVSRAWLNSSYIKIKKFSSLKFIFLIF